MKILVMGGTRFVGKSLVEKLLLENHEIDIFTRGIRPVSSKVNLIKGDRNQIDNIKNLKGKDYDFVFDISGREVIQTKNLLENINNNFKRYVYVSSAGVYKDCDELPLLENNVVDPESRHKGKFETENWLIKQKIPFTSFRPTYIYGPNNYNKLENWFFERIVFSKEIPLPRDGNLITQLGHVSDLTDVMIKCLDYDKTINNIYNCSGEKGITVKGLILKCAEACNIDSNNLIFKEFNYKDLDPKSRKSFPIRLGHYQTSIYKIMMDLDWEPKYDLLSGLKDSFENDFKYKINEIFDNSADQILFKS